MTARRECDYCGGARPHDACRAEWMRRRDTRTCMACGGADAVLNGWCRACLASAAPYSGYPGAR